MAETSSGLEILVVSQFFAPEMGAPAARFHDFGRLLVERGHRVRVITGFPNSPSGRIPEPYRGRFQQREWIDGIEVLRGWLYASPKLTAVTQSLGFGSFAASAGLRALLGRLRADVVIATSPPPTVGLPGVIAARRLGAPLVFDVRDIWPEAIAKSGRLKSGSLIRALEFAERSVYNAAAAVTVVTEGKRNRLLEKGVPEEKIAVIPNGVDLSRFDNVGDAGEKLLRDHGVDLQRFVVLYAGVFNPPQGLDILLDAAARLCSENPAEAARVQFALVGDGSERRRLERRVTDEALGDTVRLLPEQPRDFIPSILCAANAIAVTLRPRRDSHTVPSKIYEAMASGRPVLLSADGAPAEIIRDSRAGLATPAQDVEKLIGSIRRLMADPGRAESMGARGRDFAAGFDRNKLVERFEAVLERVTSQERRQR